MIFKMLLTYSKFKEIAVKTVAVLLTSEPKSGGEHQYLVLLMESLAKCNGKYFKLLPICDNLFWINWCEEYGISYVRNKTESYSYERMQANARFPLLFKIYNTRNTLLGRMIKDNKIDLLIAGQQGMFLPQCRCKVIQPVHDLMHRYEPGFKEIQSSYRHREVVFSSRARIADVILVDSELGKKQYLESYCGKKNRNLKIEVLLFVASVTSKKEEYVETPPKYIFYPAQFWEHKNHNNLLKAIKILRERIPDIYLILVGSERNSMRKVRRMIQENSLTNHVSILGFISDEQIKYLYRHAVALVMPTYFGPTNIPPLEAMELGCPVIVSNKYAMCEQVGDAGLLCDPDSPEDIANCIMQVWGNEEKRKDMIVKGYEQCRKWTRKDFKRLVAKIVVRELME